MKTINQINSWPLHRMTVKLKRFRACWHFLSPVSGKIFSFFFFGGFVFGFVSVPLQGRTSKCNLPQMLQKHQLSLMDCEREINVYNYVTESPKSGRNRVAPRWGLLPPQIPCTTYVGVWGPWVVWRPLKSITKNIISFIFNYYFICIIKLRYLQDSFRVNIPSVCGPKLLALSGIFGPNNWQLDPGPHSVCSRTAYQVINYKKRAWLWLISARKKKIIFRASRKLNDL